MYAVVSLFKAVFICLCGGIVIGALIGNTDYLLELRLFTGVKLSQLVPLVYAVFIIFKFIYHEKGRTLKGDIKNIFQRFQDHGKLKVILIVLFLLVAVTIFIMRTGDGMLSVSTFEQRIRNWFENVLYARPRTKEFLIAFPACMLAVLCASKGWKNALMPLGVLFAIGFASVCNTFCHGRAEISLSLIRTLIGLGFGIIIGIITITIINFIGQKFKGGGKNA